MAALFSLLWLLPMSGGGREGMEEKSKFQGLILPSLSDVTPKGSDRCPLVCALGFLLQTEEVRTMLKGRSGLFVTLAFVFIGVGLEYSPGIASASPIGPGFDLFSTLPGTSITFDPDGDGPLPALTVNLEGVPIGPGNTDTIVERTNLTLLDGTPVPEIPSGSLGKIDVEIIALSLSSTAPVDIGGSFFDIFVTLDPDFESKGTMTITEHDDVIGGGTFDSFFDIFFELCLTPTGGGSPVCVPGMDTIVATDSPWSHTPAPGYPVDPLFPSGGFFPAVLPGGVPDVVDELGLLARHLAGPARIPEPPALMLLGFGLVLLSWLGRKRLFEKRKAWRS
jgi:hypothetical protein